MLSAAIDAGSNTLRLLLGKVVDGRVVPQRYHRSICRLAGDCSPQEGLSAAARARTLAVFEEFARICRDADIKQIRAVGTAAFRQAVNGEAFAARVRMATGLPLEIISGETEAHYTALGVLSGLDPVPNQALILDVGGGSTEFILCRDAKAVWSTSVALGVVPLTEALVADEDRRTMIAETLESVRAELLRACSSCACEFSDLVLVGTAGTVTTLAALDLQMTEYDWRRVNNYPLSYPLLQGWYDRLIKLDPQERERLPGMEPGRGDLIIAGLEIVLSTMTGLESDPLIVSDFGLLEGMLLSPSIGPKSWSSR